MNKFGILLLFALTYSAVCAQTTIITDDAGYQSGAPTAILDLHSVSKGLLIPKLNAAQRMGISNPATGLLVFQTDAPSGFYYFTGTGWIRLSTTLITQLADADADTRIQVEESTDEDKIRFDLGGTEKWIMQGSRLEAKNTGESIFLGEEAGLNDDLSTNYNVFIGTRAGRANTSGYDNTALGLEALKSNLAGYDNTAIGCLAMNANTGGIANTGLGSNALLGSTGNYNTAIGAASLRSLGTGGNNTAVGYQAGYSTNGSSNVFIGYKAGFWNNASNRLFIHNSDSGSPLIYGEFDNGLLRINGTLQIGTVFKLPVADGTQGQVMVTNGGGIVSWSNGPSIHLLKDADQDTQIQVEESSDEDMIRFDLGGTEKWIMQGSRLEAQNTGESLFLGEEAGLNDDLSTNYNVFIGTRAGRANSSGHDNTALGLEAMKSNLTGYDNTAIGCLAMNANTEGIANTGLGSNALLGSTGNYNTAIGAASLRSLGAGGSNTAIGYQAGYQATGSGNILVGYQAGYNPSTGSNNILIGYNINAPISNGSNQLVIGAWDLFYGNIQDKRIGIGTSTPNVKLDINANAIRIRTASTPGSSSADGYTGEIRWDDQYIYICTNGDGTGGNTDTWKRASITTW